MRTLQVPLSHEVLYTSNYFLLFSNWNLIQQEYLSTDLKRKEEGKGRKKGKEGRREREEEGKGRKKGKEGFRGIPFPIPLG